MWILENAECKQSNEWDRVNGVRDLDLTITHTQIHLDYCWSKFIAINYISDIWMRILEKKLPQRIKTEDDDDLNEAVVYIFVEWNQLVTVPDLTVRPCWYELL